MSYAIPPDALATRKQIFPYSFGEERVYVKKRRPNKHAVGKRVQGLLARLGRNPLLIPPLHPVGGNVAFEAARLRAFAAAGQPVPRVLHEAADYFVLSDVGPSMYRLLKDTEDPALAPRLCEKAARALRRLHDAGLAHGGALIRNLTVLHDEIHFIDLEENLPDAHRAAFQLRDMFLFLFSLQRENHRPDLARIAAWYDGAPDGPMLAALRGALRRMRVARLADAWPLRAFKLIDVRAVAALTRQADGGEPAGGSKS